MSPRFAFHQVDRPSRRVQKSAPAAPSLFDRVCEPKSRGGASPASARAARQAKGTAADVMRRVLEAFALAGANYNADEVAGVIGVHFIRVRPRITELHQLGFIAPYRLDPTNNASQQLQRPSDQGTAADCWQVTPSGLAALRRGPLPRIERKRKESAA